MPIRNYHKTITVQKVYNILNNHLYSVDLLYWKHKNYKILYKLLHN